MTAPTPSVRGTIGRIRRVMDDLQTAAELSLIPECVYLRHANDLRDIFEFFTHPNINWDERKIRHTTFPIKKRLFALESDVSSRIGAHRLTGRLEKKLDNLIESNAHLQRMYTGALVVALLFACATLYLVS